MLESGTGSGSLTTSLARAARQPRPRTRAARAVFSHRIHSPLLRLLSVRPPLRSPARCARARPARAAVGRNRKRQRPLVLRSCRERWRRACVGRSAALAGIFTDLRRGQAVHPPTPQVAPTGRVYSFEYHEQRAETARCDCRGILSLQSAAPPPQTPQNLPLRAPPTLRCALTAAKATATPLCPRDPTEKPVHPAHSPARALTPPTRPHLGAPVSHPHPQNPNPARSSSRTDFPGS